MSAHTPGPWLTEFSEAYVVRAQQDGGRVAIIANLRGPHGMGGRRSSAEVAANTRLISAAPDLLEALQELIECPFDIDAATVPEAGIDAAPDQVVGTMSVSLSRRRKARAAIAKATGAQP